MRIMSYGFAWMASKASRPLDEMVGTRLYFRRILLAIRWFIMLSSTRRMVYVLMMEDGGGGVG